MKKMMTMLLGILLAASVSNAALTDSGEIAANIALTTAITVAAYPTNTATGTPAAVTAGAALGATTVVQGIAIDDNSIAGWSIQVDGAGLLTNATNGATMAYALQFANLGSAGTLGTGLTFAPSGNIVLGTPENCTGTATAATSAYTFDITMTIDAGQTTDKLAGDYTDTVTLTVASLD